MEFQKYQHIERFGTTEVEGIENGTCYVFPKIDGTNASCWFNGGVRAGSRRKEVTLECDNAGFCGYALEQINVHEFLSKHKNLRLFSEFLVPHTLKTYRDDSWRKMYVFDVVEDLDETFRHIPYDEYKPMLEEFGIEYIPPLAVVENGSYETFVNLLDKNTYLIKDGEGFGEGIVIKNYEYQNKYGRQTWAKIVRSEFREKHTKTMGAPKITGKSMVEDTIVEGYCTTSLIEKTFAKIKNDNEGWSSKNIGELLGRVWNDLITEEGKNFVKKLKNPTINYKTLNYKVIIKIKETLPELFKGGVMKPKENKPEIVFRIISKQTGEAVGSYSRSYHNEYDFGSVSSARDANCHDLFKDEKRYKIAKYKVTYELLEDECEEGVYDEAT